MNLDAYMDDFGRDLKAARPRRRPRRLLVAIPPAVALATALALALPAPAAAGVDAIAAARQALAPEGEIVHMTSSEPLRHLRAPAGRAVVLGRSRALADPLDAARRHGARRSMMDSRRRHHGAFEQAFTNDSVRIYDQRHDVVRHPPRASGPGAVGMAPASRAAIRPRSCASSSSRATCATTAS